MGFTAAALLLTFYGYTGYFYLTVVSLLGISWLFMAWRGYRSPENRLWAKRLFVFSVLGLIVLSTMMAIDAKVPPPPTLKTLTVADYFSSPNLYGILSR